MTLKLPKNPTLVHIVVSIWAFMGVASAASAGAPSVDCSTLVVGMGDCLSYVSGGSTKKKPTGSCCSGLKTVMKTDAECLCEAFQNSVQFGVSLNITKAMSLPSACHISPPAITTCGVNVVPGAAPAPSPMGASPSAIPDAPSTGGGGGSEVAPSGAIGSSSPPAVFVLFGSLVLSVFAAVSLCLS